jgi:NAD(P) transhydrogenase subunit alpha
MVVIFVPKESAAGETRVAAVPETVKGMQKLGLSVQVERGAGAAAGFVDADYATAGATLVEAASRSSADMVIGVQTPTPEQARAQKPGSLAICTLTPGVQLPSMRAMREAKVTAIGLEFMPRITRAQKMDILSSQATCGGYQAVLLAAVHLPKLFPR